MVLLISLTVCLIFLIAATFAFVYHRYVFIASRQQFDPIVSLYIVVVLGFFLGGGGDTKIRDATLLEIGSAGRFRRMFKRIRSRKKKAKKNLAELDLVHNFANAFLDERFFTDL